LTLLSVPPPFPSPPKMNVRFVCRGITGVPGLIDRSPGGWSAPFWAAVTGPPQKFSRRVTGGRASRVCESLNFSGELLVSEAHVCGPRFFNLLHWLLPCCMRTPPASSVPPPSGLTPFSPGHSTFFSAHFVPTSSSFVGFWTLDSRSPALSGPSAVRQVRFAPLRAPLVPRRCPVPHLSDFRLPRNAPPLAFLFFFRVRHLSFSGRLFFQYFFSMGFAEFGAAGSLAPSVPAKYRVDPFFSPP